MPAGRPRKRELNNANELLGELEKKADNRIQTAERQRKQRIKTARQKPHHSTEERWKKALKYAKLGYDLFTIESYTGFSIDELQSNNAVMDAIGERNKALIGATTDQIMCSSPAHMKLLNVQIQQLGEELQKLETARKKLEPTAPDYITITRLIRDERQQFAALIKISNQVAERAALSAPKARDLGTGSEALDDFIKTALSSGLTVASSGTEHDSTRKNPATSEDLTEEPSDTYPES